jgi:hypothetical protein
MLCAAVVTGQFVAGKATRDALFLTSLGFHALPMMLIAASACSILLVALHARIAAKIAPTTLIQILSAASGLLFIVEWVVRFQAPAAAATLLFSHLRHGPLPTPGSGDRDRALRATQTTVRTNNRSRHWRPAGRAARGQWPPHWELPRCCWC